MATLTARTDEAIVNPLEQLIGYQLRRSSSVLMGDLARALEPHQLRPSEASVLVLIHANPLITQSEIGRILGIKRANMAPLSAALEQRGLIARRPVDGRSQGLTLTDAGAELVAAVREAIETNERRVLSKLGAEERARLIATLQRFWA
jgi:DNA-binding MarR family transcriptional regulator